MSYGMEYPVSAAQAPASERAAFIRRTYGHLAGAILAFVGVEYLLLQIPGIRELSLGMIHTWWLILLAFMGVSYLANYWACSGASPGLQYAGLGLYVLAEAILFLPLLYIAREHYPNAIGSAGVMTLSVFAGLSLAVLITGKDFSFLGPILSVASLLALGLIVAGMIFGFSLGLIFCFGMVALASGYILYYTSNVLYHYRTDQHVAAALALFASVALLFWYVLRIFMSSRD
jgi:FtsH-binding integral membrane protein